jgi:hypothetical protein
VAIVVLCQVVGRVENHEIGGRWRKKAANIVKVLVDDPPDDLFGASRSGETEQLRGKRRQLGGAASERSIAWRSFLHPDSLG